eukprot:g22149.t1
MYASCFADLQTGHLQVSLATCIPVEELRTLQTESLEELFLSLDTDFSGTISFAEFVQGLAEIRLIRKRSMEEANECQEASVMNHAVMVATEAFEAADLGFNGELDLQTFVQALTDPVVATKVSQATSVPADWFLSLDAEQHLGMILTRKEAKAIAKLAEEALEEGDLDMSGELDFREFLAAFRRNPRFLRKLADGSGTISFEEFANGLLEVRMRRNAYSREEAEAENQAVIDIAYLDALDAFSQADLGDWCAELHLDGFIKAFQTNDAFLRKVSSATGLSVDEFKSLQASDLRELFSALDMDVSGTEF